MPRIAPWCRARISSTRCSDALRLRVPPSAWLTSSSVDRRRASRAWASRLRSPPDIIVVLAFTPDIFVAIGFVCNPTLLRLVRRLCLAWPNVRRDCLNRSAVAWPPAKTRPIFARPRAADRGLHLALQPGMAAAGGGGIRVVMALLVVIVIADQPARAEDGWNPPHVRPETAATQELVAVAIARSPTIRAMLDRIARTDVVVYVRQRQFGDSTLDGHIGVLSSVGGRRYLVIELACGRSWVDQISTLGHELHHAIEIADHESIVDSRTLAVFYERF